VISSPKVNVPLLATREEFLAKSVDAVTLDGDWAEFGVAKGWSMRFLAERLPEHGHLWAFDSFKGLPESIPELPRIFRGRFKCDVPDAPPRTTITVGLFEDYVSSWAVEHAATAGRLALVHLDADLYTSTKTVLDAIAPLLGPGTVMICDDVLPPMPADQEWRAVHEWMESHAVEYEWIARTKQWRASFVITEKTP
jgi:predicted O-methyltransferase YrrM